ncbi:unnamed protein product [Pieris brassicae]|uniref:DNA helicase n=1 Tax=Pieris brassicae TaxID=7116 RepID=A0A9P0TWW2_PIEBR|nr:unnamed protein product [Pieris brassicae]
MQSEKRAGHRGGRGGGGTEIQESQLSQHSSQARLAKIRRVGESSSEYSDRLESQREYATQSQARESSAERSQRLAENRERTSQARARESSADRSIRLANQNVRSSEVRERQSSAECAQRLDENRTRISQTRARVCSVERSLRLAEQNERSSQIYERELSSERSQRLAGNRDRDSRARARVILPSIVEPPEPIKSLLTNNSTLSAHFLKNARRYKNLFQMTSFGAKEIREGNFMPTSKVEGQVYHLIGSLLPPSGQSPQFLQIYFISDADQLSLRSNMAPMLKLDFINELQTMLNSHNVYIRSFKQSIESTSPENLKLIIHADHTPQAEHRGRYNAPSVNEVAVLFVDEDKGPRDIVLHGRDGQLKRVSELHRAYDPLQYPQMFVSGDDGYYLTIPQQDSLRNKTVSCMQYYAYRLMIRTSQFNSLHYYKDLFSQYCVDMMAKMISERLNFIRRNQQKLRADDYIHLRDALNQDASVNAADIGQRVILPSSFTGCARRAAQQQDQDCDVHNEGLIQIENKLLELNDKHLADFGLPSPNRQQNIVHAIPCRPHDINELSVFVNTHVPNDNDDNNFSQKLLKLGDGNFPSPVANSPQVLLDNELGQIVQSLEIVDTIYPDIQNLTERNFNWLCSRAIVSPRNESVNEINKIIMENVPGEFKSYKSIDTVCNIEDTVHYPQEYLNSLNPSGLPSHELQLKVGTPVMLLRNLCPPSMCNGTRLLVKELRENVIVATIITGAAAGQLAHIPRIPMIPTDLPISLTTTTISLKNKIISTKQQNQTKKIIL